MKVRSINRKLIAAKLPKERRTALWRVSGRGYSPNEMWRTISLIVGVPGVVQGLSKEEARQVCKDKRATVFEITLCRALIKACEKGQEKQFRWDMLRWIHQLLCVDLQTVNNNKKQYAI